MRDMKRRRRTALLKLDSVRPVREIPYQFSVPAHIREKKFVFSPLVCCDARESDSGWERKGSHTSQEAVQLHQHLQVHVLALGRLAVAAAHMVTVEVDTWEILDIG
jgi:hypothetical protein